MGEAASPRYAIYYAPAPSDPLWTTASALIGYDAYSGCPVAQTIPAGWTEAGWHDATQEPRRYGFHATLKAPFHLAEGASEAGLVEAIRYFARRRGPVVSGALQVATLGSFIALVPLIQSEDLSALASECVAAFEPFRAPLSPEDRARRRPEQLDDRGRDYLDRYGYPYVLDRFRFHMTLSGAVDETRREATRSALSAVLRDVMPTNLTVDRIAMFRQAERRSPFTVLEAFPLAG
ncbi:DUF1045 domain-containing protein [Alsobacter sp. R-9]